ncbi:benzoate/H(+) symporter BenE family transporter [Glaciihabitans sp. dw_435]|uniref:benzoate/H(+) symporter BenE family transporter n=1 Tax=Glaciihabitans sp. dw_435 TaxID=2720081 RepID=UPI0027DE7C0B|nr:benzoate/H(+) symporter BenE family transporter [Glaciihabitans sp. dw_435]
MVAAITGFATSFALVIAGLQAVGATQAQASSGLFALCLAVAAISITLTLWLRIPISFAWSTPGAALLIAAGATGHVDFASAVGAFLVCAILIVLCGLWPALGRAITRIPKPLASAMLAGILFPICLAPVTAVVTLPQYAIPIVLTWLVLFRLAPRWAVPAAMVVAIVMILVSAGGSWTENAHLSPQLSFVVPHFDPVVVLSLGLPLFVVTMAGQNVPGIVVMSSFGYTVPPRAALVGSGAVSGAAALFGGHVINLAAITAAIMASPEAHPDKERRWVSSFSAGVFYLVLGLVAGFATALVSAAPPILITAVAGLAVLGALIGAITTALEQPAHRVAAIATFLVVASGIVVLNVGSAFWGLLVGGIVMAWLGWERRRSVPRT